MEYVGLHLTHKQFGDGVVEKVCDSGAYKVLTVSFSERTVNLSYPLVFESAIVTAADASVQEMIMAEIANAKKEANEKREQKREQERQEAALAASKACKSLTNTSSVPVIAIEEEKPLTAGKKYGTASNRIYESCIPAYHFAPEGLKEFGWNNHMYAKAATKEGYSVWMLAHSNWTDTKNEKWRNTISEGYRLITEDWGENAEGLETKDLNEIRVIFAKDGAGFYVFLGVFQCTAIDTVARIKKYELISDKYPMQ